MRDLIDLEQATRELARANPAIARRLERRRARCGRASILGVEFVVGVVLADLREHSVDVMPIGTAHLVVWADNPTEVLDTLEVVVHSRVPAGVLVTIEVRRARAWHRVRGWIRAMVARAAKGT